MLCLGLKKSLSSPRLKLIAQGVAYQCSKVECEDHSAIQAPIIKHGYCFQVGHHERRDQRVQLRRHGGLFDVADHLVEQPREVVRGRSGSNGGRPPLAAVRSEASSSGRSRKRAELS